MLGIAAASGSDDRDRYQGLDFVQQTVIQALLHAIIIHDGDQQFAGPQRFHLLHPVQRLDVGPFFAAVGISIPFIFIGFPFRIDSDADALAAELVARFLDQLRIRQRR